LWQVRKYVESEVIVTGPKYVESEDIVTGPKICGE